MMQQNHSSIFRKTALEQYSKGSEAAILPRLIRPRIFIYVWLLSLVTMGGLGVSWLWTIPTYTSGIAVVTESTATNSLQLAIFVPPSAPSSLTSDTPAFIQSAEGQQVPVAMAANAPELLSPAAIHEQYAQNREIIQWITQPSLVLSATWDIPSADNDATLFTGALFPAKVQTGTVRLVEMFPIIGRFFEGAK